MDETFHVFGARLFVRDVGHGQPILFLHGNPDSADLWNDVIGSLEDQFRCVAIDLPGFGRSQAPPDFDYSFDAAGLFVGELLDTLGIQEKIYLVAHDFGGAFAMAFAIQNPERVARLVVINHPFFVGTYRWHRWARIWRTPVLGELSMVGMNWPLFLRSVRAGSKQLSREQIRQTYSRVTRDVKRAVLRLYRAANPDEFRALEPSMLEMTTRVPALVLWGRHDPYIPEWVADRFGAERVLRFPESGHWLPSEAPEEVADELRRFFGRASE